MTRSEHLRQLKKAYKAGFEFAVDRLDTNYDSDMAAERYANACYQARKELEVYADDLYNA